MSRSLELVCIACPIGCRLAVAMEEDRVVVTGNRCERGEVYGREEILAPRRTVTATVRTDAADGRRLPVKTTAAVPREMIPGLLARAYALTVMLPIRLGDVIIEGIDGGAINLVATRSLS